MAKLTLDETARCACGAVSITVKGPVLSMMICACRDCRKATGTGHSTAVMLPLETVEVRGIVKDNSRTAESGSTITRHFCPDCGTPIFTRTERAPKIVLVPAGLFDDPSWFAPNQAIFSRSHLDWDQIADVIPRYDTYREP